jgi:hypothetical protein
MAENPFTTTFSIEVNGTPKPDITLPTGIYRSAAAAIPALLGIDDFPVRVRIWVESLQLDYPPLMFEISEAGAGARQVLDLSRVGGLRREPLFRTDAI